MINLQFNVVVLYQLEIEILGVGKQQVMDILDLEVQLNKVVMIFIIKEFKNRNWKDVCNFGKIRNWRKTGIDLHNEFIGINPNKEWKEQKIKKTLVYW